MRDEFDMTIDHDFHCGVCGCFVPNGIRINHETSYKDRCDSVFLCKQCCIELLDRIVDVLDGIQDDD